MNTLDLLNKGSKKLKYKGIKSSQIDSEILLSNILGKSRENILINLDKKIGSDDIIKFNDFIERRSLKEPIAYILKEKEFWSKNFVVNKSTLIPRPETELMVEKLSKIYYGKKIFILDIGTGSGCILISLLSELKNSIGIGVDISTKALKIAKINALKHEVDHKLRFEKKCFSKIFYKKFDLIVSNPPYIDQRKINKLDDDIKKFEPLIALNGGNDGLDVITKVIYKAKEILKIKGTLALEIGNEQLIKVSKILRNNNFKIIENIKDYNENTRCLISIFNN
tara:strand:+ start:174 stop:1016 length:843 start_codon:yes stop_codon:yes gene_type:complete